MYSILSTIGPEIPFTLLLLALLGIRSPVRPQASLLIHASPDKVFGLVDVYDGKIENWGRTIITTDLVDRASETYRKTYSTTLSTGVARATQALFRVQDRNRDAELVLARAGLEGRSLNNELLQQRYTLTQEGGATRLTIAYHWGPRPLLAQILARADLWGGIYRLKSMAERKIIDDRAYQLISAIVALVTGIITLAGFGLLLGLPVALLLVFALFVHEFGHLLAYRLMGQPWGRMIFLPFLGAVAMPRLAYASQGQAVFSALMGPGFSTILALACAAPPFFGATQSPYLAVLGLVTAGLNIFNLLPVEPLDGGVALRSVLTRVMGRQARFGLMVVGALITIIGFSLDQILLVIFGAIAILANIKDRTIDAGLTPLTSLQVAIATFGYVAMVAAYITLLRHFVA